MPADDEPFAKVRSAVEKAQDAAAQLADALGGLPDAAQSAADSQVNATNEAIKDHATTAIATARQQLDKGVAALSAAAQAATDKATSLLPPK